MKNRIKHWRAVALLLGGVLLLWVAFDLFAPLTSDIRAFEAKEVARLETSMWKSYYDRRPVTLFLQLSELMRTQYHFPWLRSQVAAYHAARAAFVFKDGRDHADYERALPSLEAYYAMIAKISAVPFDVSRTARFELEWWIVHREVHANSPERLQNALADLQASIYHVPAERLSGHARARADAMLLRDREGEHGQVSDRQWEEIQKLLELSWHSLWQAIQSVRG